MVALNILFIRKLIIVYGNTAQSVRNSVSDQTEREKADHKSLVTPITKLTVLLSISVITTILDLTTSILYVFIRIEFVRFIAESMAVIDLYTNFMNVMLTYAVFKKHYYRICGCMDKKCRKCWLGIIMGDDEIQLSAMMSRSKSLSANTSNSVV